MKGTPMTNATQTGLCPPERIEQLARAMAGDGEAALADIDQALADYPADARVCFLRGSLLASLRRYDEARLAMRQAVDLAPEYAIARFQAGFLELTSGQALAAEALWRPLEQLEPDNFLRLFAAGLTHMAHDRFEEAITALRDGMALNAEIPPLNNDMQLIIDELQALRKGPPPEQPAASSSHLLLQQYLNKTKH
jgi:tetratricopeptide (TPR) repeat protein